MKKMKVAIRLFEFATAALVFVAGIVSGNAILMMGWVVSWIVLSMTCEFGVVVLTHFERVEQHQCTIAKDMKTVIAKFSQLTVE